MNRVEKWQVVGILIGFAGAICYIFGRVVDNSVFAWIGAISMVGFLAEAAIINEILKRN